LDECLPLPRLYVPAYLETNPMAFGLVLGTKFLVYITALCLYVPAGTLVHYQWMNLTLVAALFIFYKTWKSDPGHILKCTNPSEAHRTITELCERGLFHNHTFCTTCLVRRPLRSKHCQACNRCVARFDHHCPWIDNCVGLRNHKIFLAYLVFLLLTLTWGAKASLAYLFHSYPAEQGNFVFRIYHYITVQPWVGFIMVMCFIHLTWVYLLLLVQIFQVSRSRD